MIAFFRTMGKGELTTIPRFPPRLAGRTRDDYLARRLFFPIPAENRSLGVVIMAMNPQRLAQLIEQHTAVLTLYARQWSAEPDDLVQEAFLKLVQARREPDDPRAWLFRVVRNAALDAGKATRRRTTRERERVPAWFVEPNIDGLDAEQAVAALQQLSDDIREVIVARLWGGLTLEQIAQVANCSVSSVHRRYEAGIAQLRKVLGVPCPTDPM